MYVEERRKGGGEEREREREDCVNVVETVKCTRVSISFMQNVGDLTMLVLVDRVKGKWNKTYPSGI